MVVKSLRWTIILGWIICLGVTTYLALPTYAQAVSATDTLDTAINGLDSVNPGDWEKSQATLLLSMKNPAERERATCALAIFHIKRGNTQAIANLSRKLNQLFPQPSPDLDAQLQRIQLWHALASEQADQATKHMSKLLEWTLNGDVAEVNKLATFDMLGRVVGMLECDAAQSPIDHDQLSRAKVALSQFSHKELAQTFSTRYNQAAALSAKLAEWFHSHARQSNEEMAQAATQELAELSTSREKLDHELDGIRLEKREMDSQLKQLRLEKVRVNSETAAVQANWRKHPEVHNPQQPNRNDIYVPTTKRVEDGTERVQVPRYKTVKDQNGGYRREMDGYEYETRTRYRTVHLSQAEINREIDRIFIPLQRKYEQLMAMRQELLSKKSELDAKTKDLDAKLSDTGNELDTSVGTIRTLSNELKDLQAKAYIVDKVLSACKSEGPFVAFRPPNFEIINYSAEKKVLHQVSDR